MTAWDQSLPGGSRRWWISLIVDLWNGSFPTQVNIGAIAALDSQRLWPRWVKPQPHTAVHEKTDGGLVKADLQKQNPSISPQRCCFGRLCAGRDVAAARNNTFFMASPPWHFSAHTHTRLSRSPGNCGKTSTVQHLNSTAIDYLLTPLKPLFIKVILLCSSCSLWLKKLPHVDYVQMREMIPPLFFHIVILCLIKTQLNGRIFSLAQAINGFKRADFTGVLRGY